MIVNQYYPKERRKEHEKIKKEKWRFHMLGIKYLP